MYLHFVSFILMLRGVKMRKLEWHRLKPGQYESRDGKFKIHKQEHTPDTWILTETDKRGCYIDYTLENCKEEAQRIVDEKDTSPLPD